MEFLGQNAYEAKEELNSAWVINLISSYLHSFKAEMRAEGQYWKYCNYSLAFLPWDQSVIPFNISAPKEVFKDIFE